MKEKHYKTLKLNSVANWFTLRSSWGRMTKKGSEGLYDQIKQYIASHIIEAHATIQ